MLKRIILGMAISAVVTMSAAAQPYPTKQIQMVIPFGAGGDTDLMARILAERLSKKFGQTIIPENRPGAGGTIGAAHVANAPADGYTLLYSNNSVIVAKFLYRKLMFDPQKDIAPVASVSTTGYAILASPNFPANSLTEFVALVRANPGKYSYASPGVGTNIHIVFEEIKSAAGLDIVHVPYKSGNEMLAATMRGETELTLHGLTVASENAGRIKGLGVTTGTRSKWMPNAQTLKEAGIDLVGGGWNGVFAPAKTPKAVVEQLNSAVNEILAMPDVRAAFEKLGYEISPQTTDQFGAKYTAEFSTIGAVVSKANIPASD
jgi:tripartite-type tricarboxylate transporter receptor subunit TctC